MCTGDDALGTSILGGVARLAGTLLLTAALLLPRGAAGGDDVAPDGPRSAVPEASAPQAPVSPDGPPDDGDRILFGTIGEASNLIPFLSTDASSHEVSGLIFVSLLRYDPELRTEPWAAESFSVEDEGRLLRFTLRKGILWEDGKELTTEDVEYTYRIVVDPATASPYADDFMRVKELRVLDRYTFEVRYESFYARAVESWMASILPKHVLEGQDIRHTPFSRNPIGAGPYRLKKWEAGSSIVLEASPTYFMGRPHIDQVVYRVIPDSASIFLETKAGRLDCTNLSPLQYRRQTSGPPWDTEFGKYRYLSSSYVFLGFNLRHPVLKDVRVRWAVSKAMNREDIVRGVLLGEGEPAFGPYKPGTWAYHPTLRPVAQDVEGARRLLAEAGFADTDGDGIVERDGKPLAFTILTNQGNEQRILTAEVIQSQLRAVGIDVAIRTVEWAAFIREFVHKGRFDAIILGWTISVDPDILPIWHSSGTVEGGLNFIGYVDPEVDDLLTRAAQTPDTERRAELYARFQELLARDQPYCFLYVPNALPVVQRRFRGIKPTIAGIMYNFDEWWVPRNLQRHSLQQ
ncbi:MAG: peptide-binding protein [Desulfovibrio sp.]|nr:peptide-binding protein [Desulfovibrio sp.]